MQSTSLRQYLQLGIDLGTLLNAKDVNGISLLAAIHSLESSLRLHGFRHACVAMSALREIKAQLTENPDRRSYDGRRMHYSVVAETVVREAVEEATGRQQITLDTALVESDPRIQGAASQFGFDEVQSALHAEVLACMYVGSWRSAAVMAWNLAYDYLRRWCFHNDDRLSRLNGKLSDKQQVTEYEDFFSVGERRVLDAMRSSGLLTEKRHRRWVGWLDYRNDYAHANFSQAAGVAVAGRIHDLLDLLDESTRG